MDRLEFWIDQVCDKIKEVDPDAVIEISRDTFEDEDIDVNVYTEVDKVLPIGYSTNRVTSKALVEEGYNILVLPMVKSDKRIGKKVASS